MIIAFIFPILLFGKCESADLYNCDDEVFDKVYKTGNWMCKLDKNYDELSVPKPSPLHLDSKIQIYEISDVDEVEHTISIHFKHYVIWTDYGLGYLNRSL